MNLYGALVEWYWQGKTEVLEEKHYIVWVVVEWMGMEHWWNGADRGNWNTGRVILYSVGGRWMNGYGVLVEWYWQGRTELLGEKLVTCHFVRNKSHMNWPGIETEPPRWEAGDWPPDPWHDQQCCWNRNLTRKQLVTGTRPSSARTDVLLPCIIMLTAHHAETPVITLRLEV